MRSKVRYYLTQIAPSLSLSHSSRLVWVSDLCILKTNKMKKTKITYWTITGLFALFMVFSSISNVTVAPVAVEFMRVLGLPAYLLPFLGVAKLAGVVAILVPGFRRVKEWAYAGLFFDLLGATYVQLASVGLNAQVVGMVLPIGLLFLSYFFSYRVRSANAPVEVRTAMA
jgi:hypothetical protein